jgi:hypothetical protein
MNDNIYCNSDRTRTTDSTCPHSNGVLRVISHADSINRTQEMQLRCAIIQTTRSLKRTLAIRKHIMWSTLDKDREAS